MKHAFIAAQGTSYPVSLMCKQLGVSRSGYYRHLAPKSEGAVASEAADKTLLEKIAVIFEAKKKRYGSPASTLSYSSRQSSAHEVGWHG